MPCSKRSENLINRKIGTFYIEAIPPKFSQLRQKIFFRARSKYFLDFPGIRGFSKGFLIKSLCFIARRAYCVGTPLIFLFVRRLSVRRPSVCHTQFWTRILRNMHAWNSIRVQNRVRSRHFAKPGTYEDNPSVALAHSRLSGDFATWV